MHRKLIVMLAVTVMSLTLTSAAMADTDGQTIPHGGYDELTNSCLSCHDIHEAVGDYVLMREVTVTETCGTCHTLFQADPTGEYVGDYPGDSPGTAAERKAYNIPDEDEFLLGESYGGHRLGLGIDFVEFADGEEGDGNYIPGSGTTLNALSIEDDLVNATDREATNGLYCASCHTPHGQYGQILRDSGGNISTDKILSSQPNHGEYGNLADAGDAIVDDWLTDGANWCTKCHDRRLSGDDAEAEGIHNHPSDYCLQCHSNYDGTTDTGDFPAEDDVVDSDDDFPHTSPVQNLLSMVPDELCITCHIEGSLP